MIGSCKSTSTEVAAGPGPCLDSPPYPPHGVVETWPLQNPDQWPWHGLGLVGLPWSFAARLSAPLIISPRTGTGSSVVKAHSFALVKREFPSAVGMVPFSLTFWYSLQSFILCPTTDLGHDNVDNTGHGLLCLLPSAATPGLDTLSLEHPPWSPYSSLWNTSWKNYGHLLYN